MENFNCNSISSSSSGVGNPAGVGNATESVDENQDEEPSSLQNISHAKSELENFRLQWKREIESSPSKEPGSSTRKILVSSDDENIEEKAKWLFLSGIQAERLGKMQDAIALYRRAIQLVPDIEFKITENMWDNNDELFDESEDESEDDNSLENEDKIDDLIDKFQQIAAKEGTTMICQYKLEQKMSHISSLPPEIFIYIMKWVISQDLDVVSMEQIAKVCRGFYLCARDPELWRLVCLRIWDVNDTPNRYGSWRNMFIQRPHVFFSGVYISKTSYIRYGDTSFQDSNYRPCYLVEYYRYLRFFPDGIVLMLTTPDDPYQSIYKLRYRKIKHPNVMSGRYKLVGDTIMAVVKKPKAEIAPPTSNYYHHRRQRQANLQEVQEQTFHLELEVKKYKRKINYNLSWNRYSIHMVYKNNEETVTNFEIVPSNFPSFWFSRVKSFTAASENPLAVNQHKAM